ncbi:DUF334 domain-containing protein (plasmid) [Staphylococcus lugdunensis]|nr:DUF334 domain-containing protein [Staphylococcus lugdunensis]UZW86856.1 DUF334 domain-containing protein [Staphylococcus lugdunensis]
MSLKDEIEKKRNQSETQSQNTQTNSTSTGTPSNTTQNNLERQELDELKKQNKLIIKYLTEIQENQNVREKEQKQLISNLTKATKDFQDNGTKIYNAFVKILKSNLDKVDTDELANILGRDIHKIRDENERMLQEVRASHEAYQKKIKLMYRGFGVMLLVFMLFALVITIGSDFMNFVHIDVLQKAIASKIKASEGFMTLVWYVAYGLPYILAIGGFIYLYEWIRKKFEVFL